MQQVPKPTIDTEQHFQMCSQSTRSRALRESLLHCTPEIIDSANMYDELATIGQASALPKKVALPVSAEELVNLYNRTMVRKEAVCRQVYEALKLAAPNSICPLCGQRVVKTLDHYLPKSEFPELSVVPINLVPACSDCNKSKGEHFPAALEEQIIHPYYDELEDERWLYAVVNYVNNKPILNFIVTPSATMDAILGARLQYHFDKLELGELYSIHATVEIGNINHNLDNIYTSSGEDSVRNELIAAKVSRASLNINSWQTATYEALSLDQRFCSRNFARN